MNRNKAKLKYLLNIWKSLPQYPTKEDVVYEITAYLIKDGRPNGEFSPQTFKSIFGSGWDKGAHGLVINSMIKEGEIEETPKSSETKKWYRIKNNIYYKN
jgi:hypothetical protein